MEDIGEIFKNKREEVGISLKEISRDLNIDEILLENLESGNVKAFKDILELKNVATSLAKYLGLDEEEILDNINDYIFEKTSKISLNDIKNAYVIEEKKIKSPYTKEREKISWKFIASLVVGILLFFIALYFLLRFMLIG